MRWEMSRARPREGRPANSRFGPLRSLSETQLTLQFGLSATYDSHALGVMGLAAGLAAAAIAAKDFLEHLWWVSLVGLFWPSGCAWWR